MARLISESINLSKSIGALSPKALSLFCLLLPKYNSYGKMNGDPYFIKGEVCRHISWLTLEEIKKCLKEISENTDVKWWEDENGNYWIHAINFSKYQSGLRKSRMGKDKLPSYPVVPKESQDYSRSTPGQIQDHSGPEDEVEVEVEEEEEENIVDQDRPVGCLKNNRELEKEIFLYWQEVHKHKKAILDKERSKAIISRLKEGYSVDRIKQAIRGINFSPHHMGMNDRNTVYDDIELICRSGKNVDKFADLEAKNSVNNGNNSYRVGGLKIYNSSDLMKKILTDEERDNSIKAMKEAIKNTPWLDKFNN